MLQDSILKYFQPSLSYQLSLRPLFCLFLIGRLRQVLLYFSIKTYIVDTQKNGSFEHPKLMLTDR